MLSQKTIYYFIVMFCGKSPSLYKQDQSSWMKTMKLLFSALFTSLVLNLLRIHLTVINNFISYMVSFVNYENISDNFRRRW